MTNPPFSNQASGEHSFLHFPTRSDLLINPSTLLDVLIGDNNEIEYYVEEIKRRTLTIVANQGIDHLFLKRLTQGKRCAFWKSEEEQCSNPTDPRSPCYNTGWIGGYTVPITIKIVIPPTDRVNVAYEEGVRKEFTPKPWTMPIPMVSERDVLVDKYSGERYEVLNVTDSLFRGLPMLTEFDMRLVNHGPASYINAVPLPAPL